MPAVRTSSRRGDRDVPAARPRSDAYTGLLLLALVAQIAGGVFLYLDYKEYPEAKPKKVQDRPAGAAAGPPAGGPAVPPGGGGPNVPPGGGRPGGPGGPPGGPGGRPGVPPGVPPGGQPR